jgi:hypothetical protein
MKSKQGFPLPFVILIVAGLVSLFSLVASRTSRASAATSDSLHVQMVEQERVAALYFGVLSWLSDVTSRPTAPSKAAPAPRPEGQVAKNPQVGKRHVRFELCTFRSALYAATRKRQASKLN